MRLLRAIGVAWMFMFVPAALPQVVHLQPQIETKSEIEGKVTVLELAPHFVTTIRMPEAVNSVVVGDPSLFQVEHSEREPELVFVKALTTKPAETNLLISTMRGREATLLLVSRGENKAQDPTRVDFLLRYKPAGGFLVEQGYPSALVGQIARAGEIPKPLAAATSANTPIRQDSSSEPANANGIEQLLERQERASMPRLYGQHVEGEEGAGDHVRAGVSEVIDGGQQVIVLFSAVNATKRSVLLMPPQVQLGGKKRSGKVVKHSNWSTAEQLPVLDFRLNRRRLGPGERADGVVVFERPPYKQSTETLLLQVAEAGAVDRPALAPIGFGVNSLQEGRDGNAKIGR